MNNMLNAALHYAELGFAVFPLKPHDKTPLTHHGCKDASNDPQQIKRWWKREPESNIGLATGSISNNICVVDIDIDEEKGIDGSDTLSEWERENGELPETCIAITGRGGYHYYFRITEPIKNRANILEGIDFRGDGGYVVAPPSIHSNGNEYEWEYSIDEYEIADANEVVMKLLETARKSTNQVEKLDLNKFIQEGGRNDGLYRIACHYQALEYGNDEIDILVRNANRKWCNPPLDEEEVTKIISSATGKPKGKSDEFRFKKYDKNHQTINDMIECMENDNLLSSSIKYNTLAYTPWVAGQLPWENKIVQREWTDSDDANLYAYLERYGFKSHDRMSKALTIFQERNKFSPIVEHLNCLKGAWDGKKRIDTLLQDFLGAEDTELNRSIMRLFMFGAIARAYTPACQFDYMLIFIGEQGIGKSTFLRKLAMSDSWFDGNFNTIDGDKAVERLRGMWIVEFSELLALKRAKEVESMKSFITNRSDNFRAPYQRRTTARPRQCVFTGSTNKDNFLTDTTGNRRFLPVQTNEKNIKLDIFDDKLTKDYFEQAWAEALDIYFKEKPKLVLPNNLENEIKLIQEQFTEEDTRVGKIQEFLNNYVGDRVCVLTIWDKCFKQDKDPDRKTTNEIHDIMKNKIKGWKKQDQKQYCGEYGVQRCYERVDDGEAWEESKIDIPF